MSTNQISQLKTAKEKTSVLSHVNMQYLVSTPIGMYKQLESRLAKLNNIDSRYKSDEIMLTTKQSTLLNKHLTITQIFLDTLDTYIIIKKPKKQLNENNDLQEIDVEKSKKVTKTSTSESEILLIDPELVTLVNKYSRQNPMKSILCSIGQPEKEPRLMDESALQMAIINKKGRGTVLKQKLFSEIGYRSKDGWFLSFDTLTIAPDKVQDLYQSRSPIKDYTDGFKRMITEAEIANGTYDGKQNYSYFCVFEFGDKQTQRQHYHMIHLMRTLPKCAQWDINFGLPSDKRTKDTFTKLGKHWTYGSTMHKPLRFQGDSYGRKLGWLHPIDNQTMRGRELQKPLAAATYVSKYVTKATEKSIMEIKIKQKNWLNNASEATEAIPIHTSRLSMSRGFGQHIPSMEGLSLDAIAQLTHLSYDVTKFHKLISVTAKKEIAERTDITINDFLRFKKEPLNAMEFIRNELNHARNPEKYKDNTKEMQDEYNALTYKIPKHELLPETLTYLENHELLSITKVQPQKIYGSK